VIQNERTRSVYQPVFDLDTEQVIAYEALSRFPGNGSYAQPIKVELTEHLHVEDYERFTSRLVPLRAAGVEIAIDDFGAGYASLRHILKVKPDWIKLDISLTERVAENAVAHALATALISFADEVRVSVIAEGIEMEDELDALRDIGFRYGQGFYFGVPAPLDEALAQPFS
jgi:EAL domain-containing protein (putative c-di-GMP-specific phosphodiesterase class I)